MALLAAHSFPAVGRTPAEWESAFRDDPHGGVDHVWVGEEAGEPIASCLLLRFRQWIGGVTLPVMGLGTVAISATRRRRGIAGRLLATGFRHALERGDVASGLYPFRTSFYQRLGYGMAGEARQYRVPPEVIADSPERAAVRLVGDDRDRAAVRAVYDEWAPRQNGQMERAERAWEAVWEGGRHGVVYRDPSGTPCGYLVFRYMAGVPRGERELEVEEAAWTTPEARRGLHGWLGSLGDQWQRIVYRAHPDDPFAGRLSELRHPQPEMPRWHYWFPAATVLLGPMFRLLDVPASWRLRTVDPEARMTVSLRVEDAELPENAGPWRLRLEGGRVEVEAGGGAADLELSTTVSTLSRLFIGALPLAAAVEGDLAVARGSLPLADLDRALRLPRPWTFDRF